MLNWYARSLSSGFVLLCGAFWLATGCGDDEATATRPAADAATEGATDSATDAPLDTASDATDATSKSPVGDACTQGSDFQGSCPTGYGCGPFPGGYCTQPCLFTTCPTDSSCVMSPKYGELCAKTCDSDDDCRKSEGYVCDPAWQACTSWVLSPKLKACAPSAPLPRTTFGKVTQLSTPAGPGKYDVEPAAALDAAGNLTAVFMARNDFIEDGALAASTLLTTGAVNGDRPFTSSNSNLFDTWMDRDRTGKLHLVWFGHDGQDTNSRIDYATSTDGVTWSAPKDLLQAKDCPGKAEGCTDKPMIAIGPHPSQPASDVIYVAHFSGAAPAGLRVERSLDGGQNFEPSVSLPFGGGGEMKVASDGSVHVVTATGGGDSMGDASGFVAYAFSTDAGLTFTTVKNVEAPSEPTSFYFSSPHVVYNPSTKAVHIAYPTGTPDGVWDIHLATSTDSGVNWTRIKVNDDPTCANHAIPSLEIDEATGKLHVAWIENRGGVGQLAYTVCDADGSKCEANQAISSTPFASYDLVRHSPHWMAEYFELLLDPSKKEIHAVWTQPVDENGAPTARIFHSKGSY